MDHDTILVQKVEIEGRSPLSKFVVQAPGKCLLTGGYLILEKEQKGLSVSVDAYTQASVCIESRDCSYSIIHVKSTDLQSEWTYSIAENDVVNESTYGYCYSNSN